MRRVALAFRVFLSLLVVTLIVGVYTFMRYVNSPASASSILSPTSTSSQKQVKAQSSPVAVSGTYASFTYPSIFTPLKPLPISGNILAIYSYEHRELVTWQLTITINLLPGNSMKDDSSYYSMLENPTRYNESTETVNGNPVIIMTNLESGGFDKIAYIFHGFNSVDISLNSEDAQDADEEQAALNEVVSSWQWK